MKASLAKSSPLFIFLLLCLLVEPSYAQKYEKYCNARFDYCVEYPIGFLSPQGEADNADGQAFLSKDAVVSMKVWGSNNVLNESLKQRYYEDLQGGKNGKLQRVITYRIIKQNYYVVSGREGKRIFYQKTSLANDMFKTLLFEYPVTLQKQLDPIVTRSSRSFQ
jgi:hypothetical protein